MASRLGARVFAPALRRVVHRQAHATARRQFSSNTHGASNSGSGDTPWIVVSALVFVPTIVYLFSPSARSNSHEAHSATSHDEPHTHAQTPPPLEPTKSEATIADAEGTEVPVEEVKASLTQAITQDAPKEAAQAEANAAQSNDGVPGQTSEAETGDKQSEKPHDGTPQGGEDAAKPPPPDLSDAPEESSQEAVGEESK